MQREKTLNSLDLSYYMLFYADYHLSSSKDINEMFSKYKTQMSEKILQNHM